MKQGIVLCVILLYFFSCGNYKLSTTDIGWNPYKVGDQIKFTSQKGNKRIFKVKKIDKNTTSSNPYGGPFSGQQEQLIVLFDDSNNEEYPLFAVFKDSKGESHLNFFLNFAGAINESNPYTLKEIGKWPITRLKIGKKTYMDVLVINPDPIHSDVDMPQVKTVYWSKKHGYIGFKYTNEEYFTIVN